MAIVFAQVPFKIVHGTAWTGSVIILDQVTRLPVDLTGIVRLVLRLRAEYTSTVILLEASTEDSTLTIPTPATGEVEFHITSAMTHALPTADYEVAVYPYDMIIERIPNEYEPGMSGNVIVFPQLTRLADTP